MRGERDTRKVLKLFGVAVTDFEDWLNKVIAEVEAGRIRGEELNKVIGDALGLLLRLNQRFREAASVVLEFQERTLKALQEACQRQ